MENRNGDKRFNWSGSYNGIVSWTYDCNACIWWKNR